jgi:hypothetical protein
MKRSIVMGVALVMGVGHPAAAQTTVPAASPRVEVAAVGIVPRWGQTDILGGVEGLYLVTQRGMAGFEVGGAFLRAFPDRATDICILTPPPGIVCDLRAVDRVFVANAGLRLTGRMSTRWRFIARAGPSFYSARVVENSEPTGDHTAGVMLGGAVGVARQVARAQVLFELRGATMPSALGERGSFYGVRLGLGF